jgi:hypothetical protein
VNPEVRLAEIVTALDAVGVPCLVMGGMLSDTTVKL